MDVNKIKADFPIFSKSLKNKAYLDSASTAQRPRKVIEAVVNFYENNNANVHRGAYSFAEEATSLLEETREKVANFIGAESRQIVFTSGTTDSINFVADSWGRANIYPGDEILITQAEHHSNLLPWQRLANNKGANLKYIPAGTMEWRDFLSSRTKLVAVSTDSNVLGPIWREGELEALIERAQALGAKVLLDAAQTVPYKRINVKTLGADYMAFSGHKLMGPTGVGVLYLKDDIEPYKVGGSMVESVSYDKAHWKEAPAKFEAGTPPAAQIVGLGAAIDYLSKYIDDIEAHCKILVTKFLDGLEKRGIKILGDKVLIRDKGHLVSFVVDGIHAHDIAAYLDKRGVLLRAGHHCAQPLHNLLDVNASVRACFYLYNTETDVDVLLEALDEVIKYFK